MMTNKEPDNILSIGTDILNSLKVVSGFDKARESEEQIVNKMAAVENHFAKLFWLAGRISNQKLQTFSHSHKSCFMSINCSNLEQ